jgi:vacuolar-type H+-ATPase subunit F/Vma7
MLIVLKDDRADDEFFGDIIKNNNYNTLIVYSDTEDEIEDKIAEILSKSKSNNIIFLARDFITTLEEIKNNVLNIIKFNENDGNRFFMKKFPELFVKITNEKEIKEILKFWPNSIIEQHYFIINKDSNFENIVPEVIIASPLEFKARGFNIIYKDKYADLINKIINLKIR